MVTHEGAKSTSICGCPVSGRRSAACVNDCAPETLGARLVTQRSNMLTDGARRAMWVGIRTSVEQPSVDAV